MSTEANKPALPDFIKPTNDGTGSIVITLQWPVTLAGVKTNQITMRRSKVRDRLSSEKEGKTAGDTEILMFSKLCSLSPDEIQDIDLDDYGRLQQGFQSFLSSRQPVKSATPS